MVRMPTPMPAAAMLNCVASPLIRWTISGERNVRAKKPSTTDGMPARISSIGFSSLRTPDGAYSER